MRMPKYLNKIVLLALMSIVVATNAYAGNFWTPEGESGDYSIQILKFVFGPVVTSIYGGAIVSNGDNILSKLLSTMNAGVLVIGMIIMAYTYIGGAVHTAKDGEWLGKKWDTMMVPLRTAGGMAMLLPTVAGYSFLQIVLIWCGLQAVGLGGSIWKVAHQAVTSQTLISPPYLAPNKTAKQAFLMVACRQAGEKFDMHIDPVEEDQQITYRAYGSQSAQSAGFCGTLRWGSTGTGTMLLDGYKGLVGCDSVISSDAACSTIIADAKTFPTDMFNMTGVDSLTLFDRDTQVVPFENEMRKAHKKIIMDMLAGAGNYSGPSKDLNTMAIALLAADDASKNILFPGVANSVSDVISTVQFQYEQDLLAAIKLNSKKYLFQNLAPSDLWAAKMEAQMKDGGWLHAGSFYMKIGNLNNAVQNVINGSIHATYTVPNIGGMANDLQNSAFSAFLNNVEQAVIGTNSLASKIDSQTPRFGLGSDVRKIWTNVTDGISTGLLKFAKVGKIGEYGLDPLIELKSIGDTTIVSAEAMLVYGAGALTTNKQDKSDDPTMSIILSAVVGAMLSMGMFLGIILPMMPYVFWVTGVAWWLISFVEAVVAAPIWAIAHMHPEGHDIAGRGSPGYMFVLSILVRPALMVIFLFAAMVLIKPIMTFINQGFFQALSNMTEGSMVGVMTILGTLILYSGIATKMILMVFGLINTGPDNIMRWIGGSDSVGSQAQTTAGNIQQGVDAAGGKAATESAPALGGVGRDVRKKASNIVAAVNK